MLGFNKKVIEKHGTNANWFIELIQSALHEYEKENIDCSYLIGKLKRAIEFIETEYEAERIKRAEETNIVK